MSWPAVKAVLARAAIFALVGPPVGGVALTLLIALASLVKGQTTAGLGLLGGLLLASVLLSYVFGAAPALLTGLAASGLRNSATLYLTVTPLIGAALAPLLHVVLTRENDAALLGLAFAGLAGGLAASWITRPGSAPR